MAKRRREWLVRLTDLHRDTEDEENELAQARKLLQTNQTNTVRGERHCFVIRHRFSHHLTELW